MAPALPFVELAPDVILSIFTCCDISTVVSASRTCRRLHALAFEKSVWLALLDDLKQRSILESSTSDLRDFSTDELIGLVKPLLTGPVSWTPSTTAFTPEVFRRITLHPSIPRGPGILTWENEARLLRSGGYVLFNNWHSLECWSVAEDKLVWKYVSPIEFASVLAFAVDDSTDDDSVVLMICQRTYPLAALADRKNYIQIVDLDLRKGTHNILLMARAPDTSYDNPFSSPAISRTHCTVSIAAHHFLVIDWRARSAFLLSSTKGADSLMALIPGHLVLIGASTGDHRIHIIDAHEAVRLYGAPADSLAPFRADPVTEDDIPNLLTHLITPTSFSPPVPIDPISWGRLQLDRMSVHESPLRKGTYRIWLYMSTPIRSATLAAALCSQELTISADHAPQFRTRTCTAGALRQMGCRGIAYSGHAQMYDAYGTRNQQILPPTSTSFIGEVDLESAGDEVDVAPYSGALTYATHEHLVILYFK